MMKFLIPLLCIPLFGMDNAQAVKNPTAVALTNHPKTLFFHLAKGEVRNFPRPYAKPSTTGVRSSIPNWQADVKSRWRDAFKTVSITKIRISDPVASIDGGTLTSIVVNNTTSGDTTVNINNAGSPNPFGPEMKRGDPFTIEGASLDNDLNRTHYVVTSNPTTVGNITSFSTRAQATTARTYNNAGLLLRWTLDPYASGQCRFVAPNHGFEVSEQVTISGVTGVTGANGTWRVSAISKDEFVINTSCAGTYSGGGTITGPDFGSVRWAHVSVILPTIPGNGETKVDVVNSTDACHLGSQTTCRNASTSVATLLSEVPWGMQLQAKVRTGPSTESTKVVDLRTKLGNWNGVESYCGTRYWLRGPVVTELIVEGGNYNGVTHDCETDNFGWKNVISGMTTPLTGNYITTAICGTTDASCATSTTEFDIFDDPNFVVGDLLWFNTTHGTQPPLPASYVTSFTIEVMQVVSIVGHHITVTRGYDNSSTMTAIPVNRKFGVFKWEDSDVTGWKDGIHPSFSLRYYPDWAGVRLSARLENPYWDRTASIWYSLDILTSNNVGGTGLTPRLSYGYTEHPHKARHQFQMWVNNDADHRCKDGAGTDPENCATTGGGVRALRTIVDMNRAYLQYSGLLPEREMNDLTAEADRFVHGTTVTDTFYPGFSASDKGAWGVRKRVNASQTVAYSPETFVPYHPFYWPGEGTVNNWGTKGAVWVAARDWQSDNSSPIGSWKSSEGWWPMDSDAVALHCNFCESGYELSISPSTPGGGGNAMAEAHTIMFPKENQSRIYVAGWPDLGVGRGISLHGRPQVSTALGKWYSVYTAQDEPMVACSPTVAIPGSVWASTIIYWPCWAGAGSADPSYVSTGGLPPEQGHLGIYGLLGWIMSSGDFFYYEGITLEAHTVAGLAYNLPAVSAMIGRPIGTRWAGMGANANHMRMEAMPMMVLASGLTVAITEPLFGQTYMPERLLLNDYAWKVGLKREGDMSFRNGWAEQLFPSHFTFSCAGFSSVVTSPTVSDPYRMGKCAQAGDNPLGHPSQFNSSTVGEGTYGDTAVTNGAASIWMIAYYAQPEARSLDVGFPGWRYVWEAGAKWFSNYIFNVNNTPFTMGVYTVPNRLRAAYSSTGIDWRAVTWAENKLMYKPAYQTLDHWTDDGTFGYKWKTYAAAAYYANAPGDSTTAGCTKTDRPPDGCTGKAAYNFYLQTVHYLSTAPCADAMCELPRWSGLRARMYVDLISSSLSSGTATIRWNTTDGATCKIAINPPSSYDDADVTPTDVKGKMNEHVATGVATNSTFRITCSDNSRYAGTLQ